MNDTAYVVFAIDYTTLKIVSLRVCSAPAGSITCAGNYFYLDFIAIKATSYSEALQHVWNMLYDHSKNKRHWLWNVPGFEQQLNEYLKSL